MKKAESFLYCLLCLAVLIIDDGALARATPPPNSIIMKMQPTNHPNNNPSSFSSSPNARNKNKNKNMNLSMNTNTNTNTNKKNMIFFRYDDLNPGNSIPFYFPAKNPSKTPQFLPRPESDSLPFSLNDLPFILRFFNFTPNSPQSKSVQQTLAHCESPPIRGESKFCATSLESMLDAVRSRLGPRSRPNLLTTDWIDPGQAGLGRYSVVGDPVEIAAPDVVGCHPMPYPYAVFYCHGQSRGQNKLFQMEMEREEHSDGGQGKRVRVVAMCHMDTSDWNPGHLGFRLLGLKPGEAPVCHIFPPDNLVWVAAFPPASSSSPLR